MSGFGGAIKLTGETEYQRALKQINQSLRETSSELKMVSTSFASNDKSETAVAAKTEVLNKKLQEQQQKLDTLKAKYADFSAKAAEQTTKHQALVKEYDNAKQKLDEIGRTLGTTSKEYQEQEKVVNNLSQQVAESTKNEDANAEAMSKMRTEINKAQADCNATANSMAELGDATEEAATDADKAGDGFSVMKMVIANLATQAINIAIDALKKLASAIIDVGKDALENYANYEQLVGGVETLFKDSAPVVEEYANRAYKTAGLSANQYMETVTNFSASLISSLDGDTTKAAEVADRAIQDMSDNANKMGTDIGSIQNAYQGFAKQNYTMLDNLKLGYGGTKTEMERLIHDASEMTDVQKELGVTVDDGDLSFANIANAISVVQKEMGIMGTTAKEADSTIEGSLNSMKAAWQNLLTGIADENADVNELSKQFAESVVTAAENILPRIPVIVQGMFQVASSLIQKEFPKLFKQFVPMIMDQLALLQQTLPDILETLSQQLSDFAPKVAEYGADLIVKLGKGAIAAAPQLMTIIGNLMNAILKIVVGTAALLLAKGLMVVGKFALGILKGIGKVIEAAGKIVKAVVDKVKTLPAKLLSFATNAVKSFASGISKGISTIVARAKSLVERVKSTISNGFNNLGNVGLNLVKGIWNGISRGTSWIKSRIRSWVGNITSFLKRLFKIGSPSKLYEDEIGKNLALGVGIGFTDEMKNVSKQMGKSIPQSFSTKAQETVGSRMSSGQIAEADMVKSFKEALSQMKIELDDQVAGHFVERTVTKLIYEGV